MYTEGNIIIDIGDLQNVINQNFVCKMCFYQKFKISDKRNYFNYKTSTYGFATCVTITCQNNHSISILPQQRKKNEDTANNKHQKLQD